MAPAATSCVNERTRDPCSGGVPGEAAAPTIGQVTLACALEWSGDASLVAAVPSPAPNWPTITSEVGIVLAVVVVVGVKLRLLVRLIVNPWPVGTVMTTGLHPAAAGLSGAHVAVEPPTAVPQV